MFCQTRETLKDEVARTARLYIEAADSRKDAQYSPELDAARLREQEAHEAYAAARAVLEQHYREHGCSE